MGLILDSSVVIAVERRGDTPEQFVQQIITLAGNQEAALSSVGLTELCMESIELIPCKYNIAASRSLKSFVSD